MGNKMKASIMDSAICEMDQDIAKQIFYFLMYTTEEFEIEILRESYKSILEEIPIYKSVLKSFRWRDKWVVQEDFKIEQVFKVIRINDINFEEEAYIYYENMVEKNIEPREQPPMKCIVIEGENSKKKLVCFILHHACIVPPGAAELIEYMAKRYDALKNNKPVEVRKCYRSALYMFKCLGLSNIVKAIKNMMKKEEEKTIYQDICKSNFNNQRLNVIGVQERLILDEVTICRLKNIYSKYNFTVNDIILVLVAKLIKKYNEQLEVHSTHILLSVGISLRKYFDKDGLMANYYAGRDQLVLKYNEVDDIEAIAKKLKEFKQKPLGISFLLPFYSVAFLPIVVQKKIWKGKVQEQLLSWANKSFSTTNIGRLDNYVKYFGDSITDFSFMASYSYSGLPLISLSGFNNKITIYFSRYIDEDKMCKRVRDDFNRIIDNVLGEESTNQIV